MNASILHNVKDLLSQISQVICLAGGAPRDFYLKNPITDYDFYVHSTTSLSISTLESLGFTEIYIANTDSYPHILASQVIYCNYGDYLINIVVLPELLTTQQVLDTFSCTLSKCYFDFDTNTVVATKELRLAVSTRSLVFTDNIRDNYRDKMLRKFPRYTVRTELEVVYHLIELAVDSCHKIKRVPFNPVQVTLNTTLHRYY